MHASRRKGAGRSSEVECSLMVQRVIGSILRGVDPLSYFSFQPVLLIGKSSLCGGSGFSFSLYRYMVLNHMSDTI